jgi:aminoglycoside phosphotransferase
VPTDLPAERAASILLTEFGRAAAVRRLEHGESNDVWTADDIVLRVAKTPGSSDLLAEADIAAGLEPAVGYPAVLGCGRHDRHEWMAMRRLPGRNLAAVWPTISPDERARAVSDLWTRLSAVHRTDTRCVRPLPLTPFYRLDHDAAVGDLDGLDVLDDGTHRTLRDVLRVGFDAMAGEPIVLNHTDAGPGNAVWDGKHAIPIDFEFASLGPADLDIENVARSLTHLVPDGLPLFQPLIRDQVATPAGMARLRSYAVLRDTWAVSKWIANAPERRNIQQWGPVRNLHAHARGTSWVSSLIE